MALKKHQFFQFNKLFWLKYPPNGNHGIPLEINASTIKYSGNFKNYPVNVTYTFKENKNYNSTSQIKSKKFNEKNETIQKQSIIQNDTKD